MLATVGNGEALPTRLPDMNADYPFAPSVGARLRAIGRNADDRRQGLGVPPWGSYGRGVHRRLSRGCTLFAARQRCIEDAQAPPR